MLVTLSIQNFAIIDSCEMELQSGMTALTGETGAGKSILLDALGLVLGDRADANSVKQDAKRAEISAEFQPPDDSPVWPWLTEHEFDDERSCILRRVVSREGKSRGYINNRPVSIQTLRSVGEMLIDIHGQHEHQSLTKSATQRDLLDSTLKSRTSLEQVKKAYNALRSSRERLHDLTTDNKRHAERVDLLRFQLQEFQSLNIDAEETSNIESRHRRMANAGRLIETGNQVIEALDGDNGAYAKLTLASRHLGDLARLNQDAKTWVDSVNSAMINCDDAAAGLREYLSNLELDSGQLDWLDQRLSALDQLARKHNVTIDALPTVNNALQHELDALDVSDTDIEGLRKECDALLDVYRAACKKLSRARKTSATKMNKQVSGAMEELGMAGGTFICELATDETLESEYGWETIRFLVSPNPGQKPGEISKIASGGELSRISLAVQLMTSSHESVNAFIFDEVDSGIGGGIAETVGRYLRKLAENAQVLCVTHLPQVASQAHQHQRVSKTVVDKQTRTSLEELDSAQRVEEIARMLGGKRITSKTRQHAQEMIVSVTD